MQRKDVVLLDALRGHAVRAHAPADVFGRLALPLVRVNRIAVVLADEQDRQLLQRGEVERLVKHTFLGRAVAKERDHHAALAPQLDGVGIAHRVRNRGGDDRRGAHHAARDVDQVHRAAFAARAAVDLAVELGDHAPQVAAFGEIHRMAAVRPEDDVVRLEGLAGADRHALLPDRQVNRALDLVGRIDARDLFLDPPDAVERAVESGVEGGVALLHKPCQH